MSAKILKGMFAGILVASIPLSGYAIDKTISETEKKTIETEVVKQPFIEYNNRMAVFGLDHQVYERTKPNAFYVGVEAWSLPVGKSDNLKDSCWYKQNRLAELELRMGYNFFLNGRDHVTPFVGIGRLKHIVNCYADSPVKNWENGDGYQYSFHVDESFTRSKIEYGTFGFLYEHEFADIFALGLNVKGILGTQKLNESDTFIGGVDTALPITFRFGSHKHWDLRLEPFNLYLKGSNGYEDYFGFRSTVGYRF